MYIYIYIYIYKRAGERGCLQRSSGGCKSRRKESASLFKNSCQFNQHLLATTHTCDIVPSGYEMRASDGLGYWQ